MSAPWTKRQTDGGRVFYERSDEAYVWESTDGYYSNPASPTCRMWMAFDQRDRYLAKTMRFKLRRIPRKWQTAQAAMRAVDRELPLKRRRRERAA